ncbi:MAG: Glu/Leu/Phe/Val dehydrogenase [Nanoarchaeota archaeon]
MDLQNFNDDVGPEKILEVYDPSTGMRGFTVIDNTALGPAKGGIRMTPSVNVREVFRLARAMTFKNALAGLPFGGGKSGIIYNRETDSGKKDVFIKSFARALKNLVPSEYIAGPDINTTENEMKTFVEAHGNFNSATGKPIDFCKEINGKKVCGLPHELGSTGIGVSYATQVALKHAGIPVSGAKIAIEGFGNVGYFTFKSLEEAGAKIVAVSDSKGCLYNENGLSFKEIEKVKKERGTVTAGKGRLLPGHKLFELPVDVLIPGALPDVITRQNMNSVQAKIIVEAANIPIPLDVEQELSKKILIVPDFVANAGGVISSWVEYIGKDKNYMYKVVKDKITKNTEIVLLTAKKNLISPRDAAIQIAKNRVKNAMLKRDIENRLNL